jgi:transcriptional regulator with XRE-family HTH domain
MSLRELARVIDEQPTNISYWERTGRLPRSDVLLPMAKALAVTVEELLGAPKPRRLASPPPGKLGQMFNEVAQLSRREQQKIIEVINALVRQSKVAKKEA